MRALALAFLLNSAVGRQGDAWAQIWTEMEALRGGKASAAEANLYRTHLSEAVSRSPDGPRTELLRLALESLEGRDGARAAERLARLEPSPFAPRERWFLADLMAVGVARAKVVREALSAPTILLDWQVLLAWNTAVDESRALHYEDSALPIQLSLHERYRAPWSAEDLALTYKALGQGAAADRVLVETIAAEEAAGRRPAGLWERRGINALGFGDEVLARDYLGRALAQGSDDAALLLSRLDLMEGRIRTARVGFETLLLNQPPPDWAWRGWGSALLTAPFQAATTASTPSPE